MTQLPALLPGMVPLLPLPAAPAAAAVAPVADPFLALLTQLVGAAPATPAGKATAKPVESAPEAPSEAPPDAAPDAATEPEDTDVPVLPVLPQLVQLPPVAAALVVPPPPASPAPAPGAKAPAPDLEAPVAEAPAPSQPAPVVTPAPAVAAVTPAAAPAAPVAAPAPSAAPTPVARQVFPEVVRVAVTGETPKRVVVRLEPEHLGEVRVVLRTTRAGLEVSLAAGSEARAALREGAPELHRMLEAAGSPDPRIVVRHLPDPSGPAPVAGPPTTPISVRTDASPPVPGLSVDVGTGTTGGTAHGDRRDRPQQDAPPMATDGRPDRPVEPGVRRTAGLDVMM